MTDGPGGDVPSTRTEEADPPTRAENRVVVAALLVLTGLGTFLAQ